MLFERSKAEWNNDKYEVTVPYNEINQLIRDGAKQDRLLNGLHKSGVTSVSFMPESLDSLERQGEVVLFDQEEIARVSSFMSEDSNENLRQKEGLYISDADSSFPFKEKLEIVFEDRYEEIEINGKEFIFIEGDPKVIEDIFLGYSQEKVNFIEKYGFETILRIPVDEIVETNEYIWDEAFEVKGSINKVLFYGKETLGYPYEDYKVWAERFKQKNYSLLSIEQYNQKGFETLSRLNNLNVIRLRSFDLERGAPFELREEAIRAVKERNIRVLYFHLLTLGDAERLTEENIAFFKSLNESMPTLYEHGTAFTFPDLNQTLWEMLAVLAGSITFLLLACLQLVKRNWAYVVGLGSFFISIAYLVTAEELLIKLLALGVASFTPIYAALSFKKINEWRSVILQYLKAIGISALGIWLVVSLLYGTDYFLHIGGGFRGVKVLYIFPIIVVVLYVLKELFTNSTKRLGFNQIINFLNKPIKYGHLLVIVAVGFVLMYYISRSGNFGAVSSIELMVRQQLEDLLFVRPRTKEVLIGFPFYILGMYLFKRNFTKLGYLCLIPSIIGWLSIVNTFTHLHIPLYISILRSLYSLSFGLMIGLIFIAIFNVGNRYFLKWKARW